jgi:hypothetical protein
MPQKAPEEVRQKWKETILTQRESGLSIMPWCRQNNISVHTFRYWQDKFFPQSPINRSAFKEISDSQKNGAALSKSGIYLEYQGVSIHIDRQFDPLTLKQCLKVLKEMPC